MLYPAPVVLDNGAFPGAFAPVGASHLPYMQKCPHVGFAWKLLNCYQFSKDATGKKAQSGSAQPPQKHKSNQSSGGKCSPARLRDVDSKFSIIYVFISFPLIFAFLFFTLSSISMYYI